MILAFTGTSRAVPIQQELALATLLRDLYMRLGAKELHHGDCVHADALAHRLAMSIGYRVVVHPPIIHLKCAFCQGHDRWLPRSYRDRNQDIVTCGERLIACPRMAEEELRSGTWMTVRMARRALKPVTLVLPNGEVIDDVGDRR
jgi:hypothetical protein